MKKPDAGKKKNEQKKARDSIPKEVHERAEALAKMMLGVPEIRKK